MNRPPLDHAKASRLLRYLAIPAGAGALALTLTAAAPATQPDVGALTSVATIPVGQNPTAMASDSATGIVYVACTGPSPDVYAIDAATNTVVATIPVGADPRAITVNQITDTIYVASETAGAVSVIDGATNTVTATVAVPDVSLVAADQSDNKIFAVGKGVLSAIAGATNVVAGTIDLPSTIIGGLAVNPVTKKLYYGYNQNVVTLSAKTGKQLATVKARFVVQNIAVDASNNMVYVMTGYYRPELLLGLNGATGAFEPHGTKVPDSRGENGPVGLTVDQDRLRGPVRFAERLRLPQHPRRRPRRGLGGHLERHLDRQSRRRL